MSSQPPIQKLARLQVSPPYTVPPPSFPTRPGSPILIGPHSEGSPTAEGHVPIRASEKLTNRRQAISIDALPHLPDDVLLAIIYHYVNDEDHSESRERAWQSLVHVCRRWRSIVFGSPRHLNLQLDCTARTRARDRLDVWPALPLAISRCGDYRIGSVDNIIAVLERSDRVCQINIENVQSSDLEVILAPMQQPFPELTHLLLHSMRETVPLIPDSFLAGSAPRLRYVVLRGIPFPGLPKLLLSATHLIKLFLYNIPHSGYFLPEAMVTALSTMTSLQGLTLQFQSPRSCPDHASRRPPPSTRSVLSILRRFTFKGASEYLEDLVAYIDAPRLDRLQIIFFNDIAFDTPQLMQFTSRTPTSRALEEAKITLRNRDASLRFSSRKTGDRDFYVKIVCQGLDWQLSSLEQVCTSCLPPLSMLEDLYTYEDPHFQPDWKEDIENGPWMRLLHPFTAVKNLYLSEQFALRIGPALQELAEGRTMGVLPVLQNMYLKGLEPSGPLQEGIRQFVASRQATSPITVFHWDAP